MTLFLKPSLFMKDNLIYVKHILDAINAIVSYTGDADFDGFSSNNMMFDAVVREFEIIGEAARNIDMEFRVMYPEVPWHKMVAMRNFLTHEYMVISKQVIWDTVHKNLPSLKNMLENILKND